MLRVKTCIRHTHRNINSVVIGVYKMSILWTCIVLGNCRLVRCFDPVVICIVVAVTYGKL